MLNNLSTPARPPRPALVATTSQRTYVAPSIHANGSIGDLPSLNLHDDSIPTNDLLGGFILTPLLQESPMNKQALLELLIGDSYWNTKDYSRIKDPICSWTHEISDLFIARPLLLAGFSHERLEAETLLKLNPSSNATALVDFLLRDPTLSTFDFSRINTIHPTVDYSLNTLHTNHDQRVNLLLSMLYRAGWIPTLPATGTGMRKLNSLSSEDLRGRNTDKIIPKILTMVSRWWRC